MRPVRRARVVIKSESARRMIVQGESTHEEFLSKSDEVHPSLKSEKPLTTQDPLPIIPDRQGIPLLLRRHFGGFGIGDILRSAAATSMAATGYHNHRRW